MININEMRQSLGAVQPEEVSELLDRLQSWENVFGHLGAPDEVGNEWHALSDRLKEAEKERDALRAKIEEMEKQEPVAYLYEFVSPMDGKTSVLRAGRGEWNGQQAKSAKPLYALPGVKGETK